MTEDVEIMYPNQKGFHAADKVDQIKGLGDGPKRIYRHLAFRANDKPYCWPSIDVIGRAMGKSRRQVQYDLGKLVAYGLIRRSRGGPGRSTRYYFLTHPIFCDSI